MSYSNIKITQADINNNNVRSASDILIGNADDNKAVFDKLPEFIAGKHNALVDALDEVSEHAQGDTEEIDRLSAEKVNVPKNGTDLDYGEAGQMLTTKGNGQTQWEDAGRPTDEQTQNAINNWLDKHPEATTTVQDGSITYPKLHGSLKVYVTPEMFGAVGDGETDDSDAITTASTFGILVGNKGKTYYVADGCTLTNDVYNLHLVVDMEHTVTATGNCKTIANCEFENNDYYPSTGRGKWIVLLSQTDNITVVNNRFHKGVSGLYVDRCDNVNVVGNVFEDFRQMGLSAGGNGYGVLLIGTNNCRIVNNVFYNVARHSIYISIDSVLVSQPNKDVIITGNVFKQDSNAVGVQRECFPITIRPSENVKISNNIFDGVIGVAAFNVQDIGDGTKLGSDNVIINNNYGNFVRSPGSAGDRGIFFFLSEVTSAERCKNITICNNDFVTEYNTFIVLNAGIENLLVTNNHYKISIYNVNCHMLAILYAVDTSLWGNLIFHDNNIENIARAFQISKENAQIEKIDLSGNFISCNTLGAMASTVTITDFIIVGNYISSEQARTYFSSVAVQNITMRNNTIDKTISLQLNGTNIISTDPLLRSFGTLSLVGTASIAGSIRVQDNNDVYIANSSGDWIKLT